ncbi:hypothetical protein BLA29_001697 [Euroglyphus maynei]|uniref:RING-type domain-containing protein n=1 Tax=Euroglyphus maynei TaxID=6958 RepID=A0A1Y3BPZ7_EURMA|nr:hypothetical protein BLA29_001697 [Euroglyphus maynei]
MSNFDETDVESLRERNLCQTYLRDGFCMQQLEQNCYEIHGDFCKDCQQYALHPFNERLRHGHEIYCQIGRLVEKMQQVINIDNGSENNDSDEIYEELVSNSICPEYEQNGRCYELERRNCQLIHGDLCDICERYSLHPFSEPEREKHVQQCIDDFTNNRTCAICLEMIGRIPESVFNNDDDDECERSYGRLENCRHIFCYDCIHQWRTISYSSECPICRVPSENIFKTNN